MAKGELEKTGYFERTKKGAEHRFNGDGSHHYHGWPPTLRGSCSPSAELHLLQVRNGEATHQSRSGSHPLTPLDIGTSE